MARTANRVVTQSVDGTAALTADWRGIREIDWLLVGLWAAVVVLALLGFLSLCFGVIPFSLLATGCAFVSWGFTDVRAFVTGWRLPRSLALAWLRVVGVCCTGALLIAGTAVPQAWMLAVSGILIFLLLRVVCGNSGSKLVRDYEQTLLEQQHG